MKSFWKKVLWFIAFWIVFLLGWWDGWQQSPDATLFRQSTELQVQNASGTAAFNQICADVEIQNKTMIAFGVPSSSVTLHCHANPFTYKE